MREVFFILLVVLVLLGLTAFRYRKQIAGMIGLARALKEAKNAASVDGRSRAQPTSGQLVNCAECGVWVPKGKAMRRGNEYVCSNCP